MYLVSCSAMGDAYLLAILALFFLSSIILGSWFGGSLPWCMYTLKLIGPNVSLQVCLL